MTRLNGFLSSLQFQPNTLKTILLYLRHNHEQPSLATKSDDLQDIIELMDPAGASQSTWGSLTTAETRSWPRCASGSSTLRSTLEPSITA